MSKQTRRAPNISVQSYERIQACASRLGVSKSYVLEAIVASALDDLPLDDLLSKTPTPAPPRRRPTPDPETGPRGGGVCMF
jgi:hypothetical protein